MRQKIRGLLINSKLNTICISINFVIKNQVELISPQWERKNQKLSQKPQREQLLVAPPLLGAQNRKKQ